ncbi:hypothetical protein V6Z12_A11G287500 [Gossypium hirsutum]
MVWCTIKPGRASKTPKLVPTTQAMSTNIGNKNIHIMNSKKSQISRKRTTKYTYLTPARPLYKISKQKETIRLYVSIS